MAVREVLRMGDPRLLLQAQPVERYGTPALRRLVTDLMDTMKAMNGAGIAAPQIGVSEQVVIFGGFPTPRYPDADAIAFTVLVNPVLTPLGDGMEEGWEGCLSVPGLRGCVPRWAHVRYSGADLQGGVIEREATGFHARVVQHECDHLIGRLYPTRMRDLTQLGYTSVLFPELDGDAED